MEIRRIVVAIVLFFGFVLPLWADPLDRWHWRNPMPQGFNLNAVTYEGGLFIAGGEGGTVLFSSDGNDWVVRNFGPGIPVVESAYGNGTFVAVSEGSLFVSTDGAMWRRQSLGAKNWIHGVTFANGTFVAVGICAGRSEFSRNYGIIFTSSDGSKWTKREAGTEKGLMRVAFGMGLFVVVGGEGAILTSIDNGVTWIDRSSFDKILFGIAYGDGRFVAAGPGIIATSTDGITWTQQDPGSDKLLGPVAYGNGRFVVVGYNGTILSSSDGTSWIPVSSGTDCPLNDIAHGNGTFVAVGGYCNTLWSRDLILSSRDGVRWMPGDFEQWIPLYGVAYGNGIFVAVGRETVLLSASGVNWTSAPLTSWSDWYSDVEYGNGVFVAVGQWGTIMTSPTGVQWTKRDSGTSRPIRRIAYGNGLFVAVGYQGLILTSPDGVAWTNRSNQNWGDIHDIVFGNGLFIASGSRKILTSLNGVAWVEAPLPGSISLNRIAFGEGIFVASGYEDESNPYFCRVFTSEDNGGTWEPRNSGFGACLSGLAYGNDTFVGVGPGGFILQSDRFGIRPSIWVEPSLVSFGNAQDQLVMIRNEGSDDLILGAIDIPEPYRKVADECSERTLMPYGTCSVSIALTPASIGVSNAIFTIPSNDPDEPETKGILTGWLRAADLAGEMASPAVVCGSSCKITGTMRIRNGGNEEVPPFNVKIYLSGDGVHYGEESLLKEITIGGIAPGGNRAKRFAFKLPSREALAGKYIVAVIDADNLVSEIDESNNRVAWGPFE